LGIGTKSQGVVHLAAVGLDVADPVEFLLVNTLALLLATNM
jgi:hypothetical protein